MYGFTKLSKEGVLLGGAGGGGVGAGGGGVGGLGVVFCCFFGWLLVFG